MKVWRCRLWMSMSRFSLVDSHSRGDFGGQAPPVPRPLISKHREMSCSDCFVPPFLTPVSPQFALSSSRGSLEPHSIKLGFGLS
jgi:hypothetical protein